jgi:hypothetical protein
MATVWSAAEAEGGTPYSTANPLLVTSAIASASRADE